MVDALAIHDGRILASGTTAQVMRHAGPATQRLDLNGRTVIPGLIDSHSHPIRGGLWGLLLGIGVTLFLIGQKVVAFGTLPPILVIVAGIVVGIIWSCFGPAKQKDAEPARPL